MNNKTELEGYLARARQGDADALFHLGVMYKNGQGVAQDDAKARKYLEQAAEKGHAAALGNLGWMYVYGQGVAQDDAKARIYFEQAVEKGDVYALTCLGAMYNNGQGVAQDYAMARQYFEQAAEKGDTYALNKLGIMYKYGQGVAQDDAKARKCFEQAAEKGDAVALSNLGVMCHQGGRGVTQDYAKAVYYYEQAAEKGDAVALSNLGVVCHQGGRGVTQDYAKAVYYYEQAAEKGEAFALNNLGVMYKNGQGVTQDYAMARKYFEQAAEKGHAGALNNLGWMYKNGQGLTQDYAKAIEYYQQAAEKGSKEAPKSLRSLRNQLGEQHYQSLLKQIKLEQELAKLEQAKQSGTGTVPAPAPVPLPAASSSDFDEKTADYRIDYQQLTLGDEIGAGGFGTVYKATLKIPGLLAPVEVAVKQLTLPALSASTQKLFEQETLLWSQLSKSKDSPITCLYGICTPPSPYCMVMEYMPQGALSNLLHEGGPLSTASSDANWAIRLQYAMDMTEGLRYLHQQNMIHRDLKSMNVLISGDNRAKLADFGLSQVKKDTTTYMSKATTAHRGQQKVAGSLLWMAPELFSRRGRHTPQSDIYALGVVFWEMASRRLPFSQEDTATPDNIRAWIKEGDIDEVPEGTPKPFGEVIDRCRATQANARPDLTFILSTLSVLQQERREHAATASRASSSSSFFKRSSLNSGYQLSTASAPDSDSRANVEPASARQTAVTKKGYQL